MPTQNNKSKTGASASGKEKKSSGTGNNKSKGGAITPGTVPTPSARSRAKDIDSKRRGDTETFNI